MGFLTFFKMTIRWKPRFESNRFDAEKFSNHLFQQWNMYSHPAWPPPKKQEKNTVCCLVLLFCPEITCKMVIRIKDWIVSNVIIYEWTRKVHVLLGTGASKRKLLYLGRQYVKTQKVYCLGLSWQSQKVSISTGFQKCQNEFSPEFSPTQNTWDVWRKSDINSVFFSGLLPSNSTGVIIYYQPSNNASWENHSKMTCATILASTLISPAQTEK